MWPFYELKIKVVGVEKMPHLDYEIPDLYEAITRPTNINIIRSIISSTGMPADTFIEFSGNNEHIPTYRSLLGDRTNIPSSKFSEYGKVFVECEEEIIEDRLLNTAFLYNENKIVWEDPVLGIYLQPYYEQVEITLNFKYRTVDLNEAKKWQSGMRRRIKQKWLDESFQSAYDYIIPGVVLRFWEQFYAMREAVEGYGDTYSEWLLAGMRQAHTVKTNQAGRHETLMFKENQLDILGFFDFTNPPKEEKKLENTTYEISFSYKYKYDRPIGFMMKYPLVIHNQLMPKKFRPDHVVYDPNSLKGLAAQSTSRYNKLLDAMGMHNRNARGGTIVPFFDEFWPIQTTADTTNLVQFMIRVNPDDKFGVLDLKEIPGYIFHPDLLEYMQADHPNLTLRTASAINLVLYNGETPIPPNLLYVTEDLKIRCRAPLSLRGVYHLRVNIFNQLYYLQPSAEDLLRSNPKWANIILQGLAPDIKLPETLKGLWISRDEWNRCVLYIKTTDAHFYQNSRMMRPTHLTALVVQHPKKESVK